MRSLVPQESPRDINFGRLFSHDQVRRAMREWLKNHNDETIDKDLELASFIKILATQK